MRKAFKLQDLDCANCASKMESDIAKLSGVSSASISFMTSKLVLDVDPAQLDGVVEQARKIVSKYEPDCVLIS